MHSYGLVHGHITSRNILLLGEQIFIGDYGMFKMKNYAGMSWYKNKSAYSSPQVL